MSICTESVFDVSWLTFPDAPTTKFGEALRAQVEERLLFFEVCPSHYVSIAETRD